jgi:hypothetical protein
LNNDLNKRGLPRVVAWLCAFGTLVFAQAPTRIATNADALITSPVFFHGKQIAVRQAFEEDRGATRLVIPQPGARDPRSAFVIWRERPAISDGEIRGEFWDLGRLDQGDPRFTAYDFGPILEIASSGRWPPRDQLFVITGATLVESALPQAPTLRAIALAPDRYADRGVTLVGRFRGRNLYGDLPQPLNKGKWDFVLQSADAAVWVTGVRPKGKDFDLDPGARVDTGRWLEVTGVVRRSGATVWIEAESVRLSTPPTEAPVEITVPPMPKEPPPIVIFTAPVKDDGDVDRTAPVRIQFSRDMAPVSFGGHVRVTYATPAQGAAQPPAPPKIAVRYNEATRSIEISFAAPLERFNVVRIDLLDGITAADGQPLQPWSMTFTTGS